MDPIALRDAAVEMARGAGAILRAGYGQPHVPKLKRRTDLVTEFDRRSETFLLAEIARRFPGHAVLAEESGEHARPDAPVRWLIDPLDGTTNFAHNYPFFGVSIAALAGTELLAGVVYDPVRDEMFAAAARHGATLNGAPIRTSAITRLEQALLVTGFPYDVRHDPDPPLALFRAFLTRAQAIRRDGSAALNLCYLAVGRFDGFWESDLAAWDMAAGTLIVREAGGRVTRYDGSTFAVEGREILATNGHLHQAMMAVLAGAS